VEKEFKELFNPTPNNPNNPYYLKDTHPESKCVGLDSAIITNAAEADRQLQKVFQNNGYKNEVSKYTDLLKRAQPDDVDKIIKMLTTQLKNSKPFMVTALNDDTMINYIKKVVETLKIKWNTDFKSDTQAAILVGKLEEQVNQYETNKPNMSTKIGNMIDAKVALINSAEFKTDLTEELVELKKQPKILAELIYETQRQISSSLQGIIKIGLFTMLSAEDITAHTVEQLFPTKQIGGGFWGKVQNILGGVVGLPFLLVGKPLEWISSCVLENILGEFFGGIFHVLGRFGVWVFNGLSGFDVEFFKEGGKSLRRRHKKTRKGSRRRRSIARRSTLAARRKKSRKSHRRRYEKYV
jgi:hypothetical protein